MCRPGAGDTLSRPVAPYAAIGQMRGRPGLGHAKASNFRGSSMRTMALLWREGGARLATAELALATRSPRKAHGVFRPKPMDRARARRRG